MCRYDKTIANRYQQSQKRRLVRGCTHIKQRCLIEEKQSEPRGEPSCCREPIFISNPAPARRGSSTALMGAMRDSWAASDPHHKSGIPVLHRSTLLEVICSKESKLCWPEQHLCLFSSAMSQVLQVLYPSQGGSSAFLWFPEPENWRHRFLHPGF